MVGYCLAFGGLGGWLRCYHLIFGRPADLLVSCGPPALLYRIWHTHLSGAWNTLRVVLGILTVFYLLRGRTFHAGSAFVLVFLTLTVLAEVNRGGFVLYILNPFAAGVLAVPTFVVLILAGVYEMGSVRSSAPCPDVNVQYPLTENDGTPPLHPLDAVSRYPGNCSSAAPAQIGAPTCHPPVGLHS